MKLTDVYEAPITDVIDAAQRISPNTRKPSSPAAAENAEAAGFAGLSFTPVATTPSTARNNSTRIRPVTSTPITDAREISATFARPCTPASSNRCAPA